MFQDMADKVQLMSAEWGTLGGAGLWIRLPTGCVWLQRGSCYMLGNDLNWSAKQISESFAKK